MRVQIAEWLQVKVVIAGLDPAIHPFRKNSLQRGWMRGSSPRMTSPTA
jgi:hypothetical protein